MKWKDVVGWEGCYRVSDTGRVSSVARVTVRSNGRPYPVVQRELQQNLNSNGYPSVTLQSPEAKITLPVYILVAGAFLGPTPEGLEILHGVAGKQVSHVDNLGFGTHQQNGFDMVRDGLPSCKPVLVDGVEFPSINAAARAFGMDPRAVSRALKNNWKCNNHHLEMA